MDVNGANLANLPGAPANNQAQQRNISGMPEDEGERRRNAAANTSIPVAAGAGKAPDTTGKPNEASRKDEGIPALDRRLTGNFLQKTIDEVNKRMYNTDRRFSYSVHEKTGQFLVKIIDAETDEVIREIPPEKSLDAVAKMWEMAGIFVDEKN